MQKSDFALSVYYKQMEPFVSFEKIFFAINTSISGRIPENPPARFMMCLSYARVTM